jgi:hypothetical protein
MPGELVALALTRPMQRQHLGTERDPDPQVAEPLDALPERGMLALGGIQIGKHHHRQALPGGLTHQPQRQGVGDPGRPFVDGVEGRRATMIASGSGSRSGSPGSL